MTKIAIAWELLEQEIPKSHIAKHLGVSRRTIIRWSQAIQEHGDLHSFLDHYLQAKKGSRQKRKIDDLAFFEPAFFLVVSASLHAGEITDSSGI